MATAQWVTWYNQERLHEALGYLTPAEYQAALTAPSHDASQPAADPGNHTGIHRKKPGGSSPDTSARPRSIPSSRECQGSTEVAVTRQPKHVKHYPTSCKQKRPRQESNLRPRD
ncbi:transposase [Mycobacterium sp. 20091114027_K0903767]|nr:transposase [Mycobacterium sp. 20091114027_K0903767]